MSAPTCGTCRFFGHNSGDSYFDDDGRGDEVTLEHNRCARIIHGNANYAALRKSAKEPAYVSDGSGYAARLNVLPTFGCVLHEVVR